MKRYVLAAILIALAGPAAHAAPASIPDIEGAIVKIYTIHDMPDYYNPWSMHGPFASTGSGCIIAGHRILTNGHVISDETFVQVRRYGDAKRYTARVLSVSHAADLALLTVDDPEFFKDVKTLDFGELPKSQQEVTVYGFPLGGDTLSTTKGVVSRIEHQTYAHSSDNLLAVQIDAALNPGNSGGPAISEGKIVGVAMQSISQADNIGYIVPVPIIQHFFKDIADNRYDGIPSLGVVLQNLENPDLRRKYDVPDKTSGVLVLKVLPRSSAEGSLQSGDVVTAVEGHPVANDGTVEFRPRERTSVSYFVQEKQVGDPLTVDILRAGEPKTVTVTLAHALENDRIVPMERYDILPTYYIYGGVVFCPLTINLLKEWGNDWYNKAPEDLVAPLSFNYVTDDKDEIVIALKVLPVDANQGYHDYSNWEIAEVNGKKIRNLRELIQIVETDRSQPFVTFKDKWGRQIVLNRETVAKNEADILSTYRITSDRSADLKGSDK